MRAPLDLMEGKENALYSLAFRLILKNRARLVSCQSEFFRISLYVFQPSDFLDRRIGEHLAFKVDIVALFDLVRIDRSSQ